jgi:hypothetical protein
MISIDANRIFNDPNYRIIIRECKSLISYIMTSLNEHDDTITSSTLRFNKTSELYNLKDEIIQILKEIFPLFEISIEEYEDEGEFNIIVSWKNYNK